MTQATLIQPTLSLRDFTFAELMHPHGLEKLDQQFLQMLQLHNPELKQSLLAYRQKSRPFSPLEISELLLACAPVLERFLAQLFAIEDAVEVASLLVKSQDPIFVFKKWFVLKQARRRLEKNDVAETLTELEAWLEQTLQEHGLVNADRELAVAQLGVFLLQDMDKHAQAIEMLTCWCVKVMLDPAGKILVADWVSFKLPQKLDYQNLVPLVPVPEDAAARLEGPADKMRPRDGFKLTDHRMNSREVLNEIDYCVYCHTHDGDFCSKGFPVKKAQPDKGLKINPLDDTLTGCPLEEKISEMHVLKKEGHALAALAMVMVDNPMCPATGHRICNDCMKACIYQKQDPVNIPQIETGVLTDVLKLPWGVEIYDLLTRWNPLRREQWVAKPYNGLKVLIMGMGPAGFTLAHHLLMEGFAVVGTDGLKIEPLPRELIEQPIYRYEDIREPLDSRIMAGFGGVAEYGITVRWDKNFLKLIYISLMRRPYFQVFGGVRFGGTITVDDAWKLGFDHLALAVGAGLPRELPIAGSMAPGMRQANDFLMALQLTGAAKKTSIANLQVRLPAVVIGGGLTGVDTATEVQAYYVAQVEKTLERYEILTKALGEARVRQSFPEHEFEILNEFLTHGKAVRAERERAAAVGELPNFINLLRQWGGVTIAYRRLMQDSPAYRRNHEEVIKALEEGIYYAEDLEPKAARLDKYGHVESLVCVARIKDDGILRGADQEVVLPARAIFVATGAKPNIAYEFEHKGTFERKGFEYQGFEENEQGNLELAYPENHCKTENFGPFTSYQTQNHRVTFIGDTHPVFHGSVVKAIASGKRTYPKIVRALAERLAAVVPDELEYLKFATKMTEVFSAHIVKIVRHTPSVVEVKIHAPMAAKNFHPGQFYRIQNFETSALLVGNTRLQSEAMAMIGAEVDKKAGMLSLMVLEQGASSRLFATFKEGDAIAVMGPTGVKAKIPDEPQTILFLGSRMGVAQIRAVGPALRKAGNKVLYIADFRTADEVYCQDELEAAADVIVWINRTGAPIKARRLQDCTFTGEYLAGIQQYAMGNLSANPEGPDIRLQDVDRVMIVGASHLVRQIQEARTTILQEYLIKKPSFVASIYGPMQCMLKGVCAQCLQWQIDPVTGKRTKAVYACSWQDQPLELVDLDNLDERLAQNHTQEILTNLWLDYLFAHYEVERI